MFDGHNARCLRRCALDFDSASIEIKVADLEMMAGLNNQAVERTPDLDAGWAIVAVITAVAVPVIAARS